MRNCTGNFTGPFLLFLLMGILILVSGCSGPITPEPIVFTPIPSVSPTLTAWVKPFWELTATPDPYRATAVSAMVETLMPPFESATVPPGKELSVYLPRLKELPQCQSLDYIIQFTYAQASCKVIPQGSITITINASPQAYSEKSLSLPATYQPVESTTIGQASIAGINDRGTVMLVTFIKNRVMVQLTYYTPTNAISPESVLNIVRNIERNVPASSPPPLALSFPEKPQLEKQNLYFSVIQFSLITNGRYRFSSDFQQGDRICVYVAPLTTAYDKLWSIVLVDLQKNQVVKKMMLGTYAQNICNGLEPDFPKDSYTAGKRYEIRIAANEEWVATLPLVTQ